MPDELHPEQLTFFSVEYTESELWADRVAEPTMTLNDILQNLNTEEAR